MTKKSAGNSQEEAEGCVTQEEQGEFSERAGVSEGGVGERVRSESVTEETRVERDT